jgi:hypothetical protein
LGDCSLFHQRKRGNECNKQDRTYCATCHCTARGLGNFQLPFRISGPG